MIALASGSYFCVTAYPSPNSPCTNSRYPQLLQLVPRASLYAHILMIPSLQSSCQPNDHNSDGGTSIGNDLVCQMWSTWLSLSGISFQCNCDVTGPAPTVVRLSDSLTHRLPPTVVSTLVRFQFLWPLNPSQMEETAADRRCPPNTPLLPADISRIVRVHIESNAPAFSSYEGFLYHRSAYFVDRS